MLRPVARCAATSAAIEARRDAKKLQGVLTPAAHASTLAERRLAQKALLLVRALCGGVA